MLRHPSPLVLAGLVWAVSACSSPTGPRDAGPDSSETIDSSRPQDAPAAVEVSDRSAADLTEWSGADLVPTDQAPPDVGADLPEPKDAMDTVEQIGTPDNIGEEVTPSCSSAAECKAGQGCHNGLCGSCTLPEQCREGEACLLGLCGPCSQSIDCAGKLCNDGVCFPCEGDGDCLESYGLNFSCNSGTCSPTTCQNDSECMLVNLLCVDFQCAACASTLQCLESDAYGQGWQCLDGQCSEGDCVVSQDCPADLPVCGENHFCRKCLSVGSFGECGPGKVCGEGVCHDGDCWLGGQAWFNGDKSPTSGCAVCHGTLNPFDWSPDPLAPCDDGQDCTFQDQCSPTQACSGTPYQCQDTQPCSVGQCHGTGNADCSYHKDPGWDGCFIAGLCYAEGDLRPENKCQVCSGAQNSWVDRQTGVKCGSCKTCELVGSAVMCRSVLAGQDPFNDCSQSCEVCDGFGGCQWAATDSDPNNDCEETNVSSCSYNGGCRGGTSQCKLWAAGDGNGLVSDGNECTSPDFCDGLGGKTGTSLSGPLCQNSSKVCKNGMCVPCTSHSDCGSTRVCDAGICQPGECVSGSECLILYGSAGECRKWSCSTSDHICSAANDDSASCSDGKDCTLNDYCLAGSCHQGVIHGDYCLIGSTCYYRNTQYTGAPLNQCWECMPGNNQTDWSPNGADCDDGIACTADACTASGCTHTPNNALCADSNPCTYNETCSATGCTVSTFADQTVCDDGDASSFASLCLAGQCVARWVYHAGVCPVGLSMLDPAAELEAMLAPLWQTEFCVYDRKLAKYWYVMHNFDVCGATGARTTFSGFKYPTAAQLTDLMTNVPNVRQGCGGTANVYLDPAFSFVKENICYYQKDPEAWNCNFTARSCNVAGGTCGSIMLQN